MRELGESFIPKLMPHIPLPLVGDCHIPLEYDPKDDDNDFPLVTFLPLFKGCVMSALIALLVLTKERVTFGFERLIEQISTLISSLALL
jgi:hypothetical protein